MMQATRWHACGRLLLAALTLLAIPARAEIVEGSLEAAMLESRKEGKHLLVAFLGTGWSVSSKRIQERILDNTVFSDYAENELIVLRLEARRKPPMSKEETRIFHEWVAQFNIMTYPTIILLAPDGQEVFRHGYKELEAEAYVDLLRSIIPSKE